jgi:hypothetical protein
LVLDTLHYYYMLCLVSFKLVFIIVFTTRCLLPQCKFNIEIFTEYCLSKNFKISWTAPISILTTNSKINDRPCKVVSHWIHWLQQYQIWILRLRKIKTDKIQPSVMFFCFEGISGLNFCPKTTYANCKLSSFSSVYPRGFGKDHLLTYSFQFVSQ